MNIEMLYKVNETFSRWEPIWLFFILAYEALIGTATFVVLMIEYWYDKKFNENIKNARKERRRKKFEEFKLPEEKLTTGEMQ